MNQERAQRVACQKFIFIKKRMCCYLSTFFNVVLCCIVLKQHVGTIITVFANQNTCSSQLIIVTIIITIIIDVNFFQRMKMFLAQALLQTDKNIVIYEVSSNIKRNNTAERTFAVFGKIDGEFSFIFVFHATECFVDGHLHLDFVDSLQHYNEMNRTELRHAMLFYCFCSCSLRDLK